MRNSALLGGTIVSGSLRSKSQLTSKPKSLKTSGESPGSVPSTLNSQPSTFISRTLQDYRFLRHRLGFRLRFHPECQPRRLP